MCWGKTTYSLASKSARPLVNLVIGVNFYLLPVEAKVRIWVTAHPKPGELVEVLEDHQVVPSFVFTEVLQFLVVEIHRAAVDHAVLES
jgi:hypothetical protein